MDFSWKDFQLLVNTEGIWLLYHMVRVILFGKKLPNYLPNWLYHFAFPSAKNERFYCSTSLPAVGVVTVLDFGYSCSCVVVSYSVLSISLMTSDVGHAFVYLMAFRMLSLVRCLFRFLCILDNSPLSGMSFANMFCQSVVCLLVLLASSFTEHEFLTSSLSVISSVNYTLDVLSEKSSPHWTSSTFSPVIFEFYSFVFYIKVCEPVWVNFCEGRRFCV